jgi:hypothetical protein
VSPPTPPGSPTPPGPPTPPGTPTPDEQADDLRRMSPVYIAVIVVEVLVLIGMWAFQTYFG